MKVGLLTTSLSRQGGGIVPAVRNLARSLHRPPEIEVSVFGLRDRFLVADLNTWGDLRVIATPAHGPKSFGFSKELDVALAEANPDLLHVHGLWTYPSIASRRWADATARPYLIAPHGMLDPWAVRNSGWKKIWAGWLYEFSHLRCAVCLHALCEAEMAAIRALGFRNPICIIPNGIGLHRPVAAAEVHPKRVAGNDDILLYLGRLHPKKGLANLLKGWRIARDRCGVDKFGWRLVIAGWDQDGHEAELKHLCAGLELESTVQFVGPAFGTEKEALFRAASAFVLPAVSEGLPMTVIEAWSYALPVMITPQCHLPEGFQSGAALQIEPDPESIARGAGELLAMSEAERARAGQRGCELVQRRFALPQIAHDMEQVYQWLLGAGPAPACVVRH